jgi:hypothetical protein
MDDKQDEEEARAARMGNWVIFWEAEEQWVALRAPD